jgi:hypothetical protein
MDTITITQDQAGCVLSNQRGHYITRDAIELAVEFGFFIGSFEKFTLAMYDDHNADEDYPFEALVELCDEAVNWLNSGQGDCEACGGSGTPPEGSDEWFSHKDFPDIKRCRPCSGTGRGDRIKGQNFPPIVPEGFTWAFEDGDFGLWFYNEDGEFVIEGE